MTETEYAGLLLAVERCAEAIVRFGVRKALERTEEVQNG